MDIAFYHVTREDVLHALVKLLIKAHERALRVYVRTGSREREKAVDHFLWTFDPGSFLPHGTTLDDQAELQPILVGTQEAAANAAPVLMVLDGVLPDDLTAFERVFYVFDGENGDEITHARAQWRRLKAEGLALTYWSQSASGGWTKTA